ncbi:acyl--CoA ligase [Aestuariivirga sp.]|uniref:acyl--CoA ligase n=1 Tax=Aestuariivirga sp. TaxID=2650926 RepID=UPI0039E297FD
MNNNLPSDLLNLLLAHGPERPVIGAPGRQDMTRGELVNLTGRVASALSGIGVQQQDTVAIVMPNGPEMTALFIAVASSAVAAPLNSAYRDEEFDFYLGDLNAKAVIMTEGVESPVRVVAARRGIPVIELRAEAGRPAGTFSLSVPMSDAALPKPSAADIALVLHTSGTTSRPKIVPLSHANLTASAANIAATLALTPHDRSLVIMPMFHIHGLVGAILSSVSAGASLFCPPGFNALKFFGWLEEARATWYTAVPTMHQTILARASRNSDIVDSMRLRFIRSSSASLPRQVMAELESVFGCPVIESYGMTEAAHQMASNPLPPRSRKPGSVGLAAGPEVAIMGADGQLLPRRMTGEVVIRGSNVTRGYANNPEANAKAFVKGWFLTGDQGVLDEEGYLTLTGRLKEIINRGGEKISPLEVDEVLLDHPAVAQAVTFAMPHDKLGEEVAAAVVLHEGQSADESSLREFAARKLADFKVPRKLLILSEIPKGPTGKIQRIGLAGRLGLSA